MALEAAAATALLSVSINVAVEKLAFPGILKFFKAIKLDTNLLPELMTKLKSIDSLVDDAERRQFTNPRVRDWLLEVKDVVLDTADLMDDIKKHSKIPVDDESESQTLTGDIKSRMKKILKNLNSLSSQNSDLVGSSKLPQISEETSSLVETDIYGRDDDKRQIVDWLISNNHDPNLSSIVNPPSILSIVGMGGVGKTALAQHVFNDPRLDAAGFGVKAWIWVSNKSEVFEVSKAILEAVTIPNDDSKTVETVHQRLKEKLTKKKFLLVLDDFWNENKPNWEKVQKALMFGVQGSRILVTTRSKEVASTMQSEVHPLKQLHEDHSWKLFAKYALRDDTQLDPECKEIGMKIVEKCKGLPLALKTVGELLRKNSFVPWKTVFQNGIWGFPEKRCDIIPALALSYIHLPSDLKTCFAYCALFPKDYEFEKEHLMHLWMTENLLHYPQEEVCRQYFNDLLSRSFFQQSSKNEEVFVMHDLLNDLAKYVVGGIYFRWEVGQTEKIEKVTRHFSVELGNNKYFDGFETLCHAKRLYTFMPIGSLHINMLIHDLFCKFKFLRFLSLSGCSDIEEVPDSVDNLEHLRSLDLSCTAITKLTERICSLSQLQILKLNFCIHLEEFPSNLPLLTNLCRLELIANHVKKVPPHLGELKNLKVVMKYFNVGHGREFGIQQLGEVNLDGSLSIRELQNIENSQDASEAELSNKTLLVKLELRWRRNGDSIDSKKEQEVIKNLQPSENLKELSIFDYGGKQFPNWLHSLPNLVSLELNGCKACERLPPLGLLPFLKDLMIRKLDGIVSIDADFNGNESSSFISLETLEFSYMKQWKKWECQAMTGAFPNLRSLFIQDCPKLKGQLPEQLVHLEKLKIKICQSLRLRLPGL